MMKKGLSVTVIENQPIPSHVEMESWYNGLENTWHNQDGMSYSRTLYLFYPIEDDLILL